jgi:hypothetical protein
MEARLTASTVLACSLAGAAASVLTSITLTIAVSLHGFLSSAEDFSNAAIVFGTVFMVVYVLITSAVYALLVLVPLYAMAACYKALRRPVVIVGAIGSGVLFHEVFPISSRFEDLSGTAWFAFFGFLVGMAFLFGSAAVSRMK